MSRLAGPEQSCSSISDHSSTLFIALFWSVFTPLCSSSIQIISFFKHIFFVLNILIRGVLNLKLRFVHHMDMILLKYGQKNSQLV